MRSTFIHESADVDPKAKLGEGVVIWNWAKVREGASIGSGCNIGQNVYIDVGVTIGSGCKIQNGVSIFKGVSVGDGVFIGPNATFTNDRFPRALSDDWVVEETRVHNGASIGAQATIVCGIQLGAYCMVGAGAVVTRDVPPFGLVVGNPARLIDLVDEKGRRRHDSDVLRHAGPSPMPSEDRR